MTGIALIPGERHQIYLATFKHPSGIMPEAMKGGLTG